MADSNQDRGGVSGDDWCQQRSRIRSEIRARRRSLLAETRAAATDRIVSRFASLAGFRQARRLAGFLAFDGEADPLELMITAHRAQKEVFVPVIIGKKQPLQFCPWEPGIKMRRNHFGIDEPDVPRENWIEAKDLDLVICPLVAFDLCCHRLGVGGGYYDRSFGFLNGRSTDSRPKSSFLQVGPGFPMPLLAGFAFDLQRIPMIQPQPWDVFLDLVVTERKIYRRDPGNVCQATN